MPSVLLSPDNDYRTPPAPTRFTLDRAQWDAVMSGADGIGPRLRALEAKRIELQAVIDDLRLFGLERLDTAIVPLIDQTQADLAVLRAAVENTIAQNAAVIANFQEETTEALHALNVRIAVAIDDLEARIAAVQQQIDLILAGGIPAADVEESDERRFVSTAQRAEIGQLRQDHEALVLSTGEALDAITAAKQSRSEKNQPNGYLGLDSDGEIPQNLRFSEYPIGSVAHFAGSPGPKWLKADGAVYLKASYPDLAAKLAGRYKYGLSALGFRPMAIPTAGTTRQMVFVKGKMVVLAVGSALEVYNAPEDDRISAEAYTRRLQLTGSYPTAGLILCEDDQRLILWSATSNTSGASQNFRVSDDGGDTWTNMGNVSVPGTRGDVRGRSCRKLAEGVYVLFCRDGVYRLTFGSPNAIQPMQGLGDAVGSFVSDGKLHRPNGTSTLYEIAGTGSESQRTIRPAMSLGGSTWAFEDGADKLVALLSTVPNARSVSINLGRIRDISAGTGPLDLAYVGEIPAPLFSPYGFGNGVPPLEGGLSIRNDEGEVVASYLLMWWYDSGVNMPRCILYAIHSGAEFDMPVASNCSTGNRTDVTNPTQMSVGMRGIYFGVANGFVEFPFAADFDPSAMFVVPTKPSHYIKAEN